MLSKARPVPALGKKNRLGTCGGVSQAKPWIGKGGTASTGPEILQMQAQRPTLAGPACSTRSDSDQRTVKKAPDMTAQLWARGGMTGSSDLRNGIGPLLSIIHNGLHTNMLQLHSRGRYALETYSRIMRCVLKNDPFSALQCIMMFINRARS